MLKIEIEDFSCGNIKNQDLSFDGQMFDIDWHEAKNQMYLEDNCLWVKSYYKNSDISITFDIDKEFIQALKALTVFMESMEAMRQDGE